MPANQQTEITTFTAVEDDWWTPQWLIEACRRILGRIDLDPATCVEANERVRARYIFTREQNGLVHQWDLYGQETTVFLNPPSKRKDPLATTSLWVDKTTEEYQAGRIGSATLIVKSNLGYNWYEDLYRARWVCHLKDLPRFLKGGTPPDGNSKKGVSVVYFGHHPKRFYKMMSKFGRVIPPETTLMNWAMDYGYLSPM